MIHLDLEGRLRKALQAGSLMLHYQPFVDLETGRVQGVEALLRWNDAERGMIPPDDFIPLAEESGAILELGHAVLFEACRESARWRTDGPTPRLAVNLSARQFHRGEVVELVQRRSSTPTRSIPGSSSSRSPRRSRCRIRRAPWRHCIN